MVILNSNPAVLVAGLKNKSSEMFLLDILWWSNLFSSWSLFLLVNPLDTERKLNVHKAFRSRPGCLSNVLFTFNLRPGSRGEDIIWNETLY